MFERDLDTARKFVVSIPLRRCPRRIEILPRRHFLNLPPPQQKKQYKTTTGLHARSPPAAHGLRESHCTDGLGDARVRGRGCRPTRERERKREKERGSSAERENSDRTHAPHLRKNTQKRNPGVSSSRPAKSPSQAATGTPGRPRCLPRITTGRFSRLSVAMGG